MCRKNVFIFVVIVYKFCPLNYVSQSGEKYYAKDNDNDEYFFILNQTVRSIRIFIIIKYVCAQIGRFSFPCPIKSRHIVYVIPGNSDARVL